MKLVRQQVLGSILLVLIVLLVRARPYFFHR
jgi:uncharacterized membrane protein (GlpM family)